MTVYDRICSFTYSTGFKFKPDFRKYIGINVSKRWREHGGTMDQLDSIQITEETGKTWMVLDYPISFQDDIDSVIEEFVMRITTPKVKTEKPLINNQSAHPISYSSDTSKKKERKRKPIPVTPQREFSGKKLIKNK